MFQGQERQTDIDLNWDSFKYRNYDYAIGRFFNVDPLAEKFPYNGIYNFSENRVVDGVELEGLEYVSAENTGLSPELISKYRNDDGTYNLTLGDLTIKNVEAVEYNGKQYFNLGRHLYYGENGFSFSGSESEKISEWVYTDIQLFDSDAHHVYTWADPTLTGNNSFGKPKNTNCADLANAQAQELGTHLKGGVVSYSNAIKTYNAKLGTLLQLNKSIDYIHSQLEKGNAVVVGVNDGPGGTDNLGTDHYITITGRTSVNGTGVFLFIENAIGSASNATDFDANRLIPGVNGINGNSPHWYNATYNVTRVQTNQ